MLEILSIVGAVIIGTVIVGGLLAVAVFLGSLALGWMLSAVNPRVSIDHFELSVTHLCEDFDCSVIVSYKLNDIKTGTEVTIDVYKDGKPMRPLLNEANRNEFNEIFSGVDNRLFDGPGVYELLIIVGGDIGYNGPFPSRQVAEAGPLVMRKQILLMPHDAETLIENDFSGSVRVESASSRDELSQTIVVGQNKLESTKGSYHINCKQTQLRAITLTNMSLDEPTQEQIEQVRQLHEYNVSEGLNGLLIPEDNPTYGHAESVFVKVVRDNGNEVDLGEINVGETKQLPSVIEFAEPLQLSVTSKSGSVPYFPYRTARWQIQLHVYCV